jgi:hypothetical protein
MLADCQAPQEPHEDGAESPSKYTSVICKPDNFADMNAATSVLHVAAETVLPPAADNVAFGSQNCAGSFMLLNLRSMTPPPTMFAWKDNVSPVPLQTMVAAETAEAHMPMANPKMKRRTMIAPRFRLHWISKPAF